MTNHGQPWLTKAIEKQLTICFNIYPKIDQKSSKNGPKIDQKSIQKRSKIDPKSVLERVSPSKPFLDRFRWHFGSNLEPSWGARWGHVGAMLDKKINFWRCLKAFKNDHHFQHHSGPSWDRFWNDFGVQNGAEIDPRSVSRAIMQQMQSIKNPSAGPMFLRIREIENRSKNDQKSC